ncbi:aminotransferase class V-fold PLP-dependent enzyme [Aeromicrobium sp. UC242_57]|uniref:aminotransferase class V-fold PLP-dependent enzyme n=1 Tax=Aeromicrobium sp. UC242_57 TaxID=3374624 RepID=UPI0037A5DE22
MLAHRRISLEASGVDYVAFSGHKVYAPFGAGALIGRRDWLDTCEPYVAGGGAVVQVTTDSVDWTTAPARHEGGTPNLVGAVALAEATEQLAALPEALVREHEETLFHRLVDGLSGIDDIDVARVWSDSATPIGVATFRLRGTAPELVAAFLAAEHGVSRDGRFCAHPLLDRLAWGAGAVRASIGVGTTIEDIDRLIAGLRAWTSGDIGARYVQVDGVWVVDGDTRPVPQNLDLAALSTTLSACAS